MLVLYLVLLLCALVIVLAVGRGWPWRRRWAVGFGAFLMSSLAATLLAQGLGDRPRAASRDHPALVPGEVISTKLVDIQVPASPAWHIAERTPARVALTGLGSGPGGTLVALVIAFGIESPRDQEHFLALIRAGIDADTPAQRYRPVQSTLSHEADRGYPCIRHIAVHDDLAAAAPTGRKAVLTMQTHSLYCLHPHARGVAFMAGYSHRGQGTVAELDATARQFIEGVTARRP